MNKSIKLGPRTPESRKALHLMTVDSASIVPTLGLPPPLSMNPVYVKAALCLIIVVVGLSSKDSHG